MKVSILKENLSKALNTTGRIVNNKGTLPVLSNILLSTEDGRIRIASTNLEIGINYFIGAKIEKKGSITVPARLFTDYITSLPNEKVDLDLNELTLKIKSINFSSEIKGISGDEFPLIPNIKNNKVLSLKAKDLKEALKIVYFAASVDDSRPILSGIYFNKNENNLTLVATDSYRLAEKTLKIDKEFKDNFQIIVPVKTVQEVFKIISDNIDDEVVIYINENQILFEIGNIELISRLIEGQFPNYKQIIPENSETKATLNTNEFVSILKTSILFAKENANTLKIIINSKGKLEVIAEASQIGSNDAFIEAEVEGKGGEISFNGRYLLDILQNINTKEVSLEITGKLSPGLIKTKEIKDYLYLIMPLRS
jgi:DNA polymerase III subunit beta